MSREAARVALTNVIEARKNAWTEYPLKVELPNQAAIDPATQSDPFLKAMFVYHDAYQASLGPGAIHRALGHIVLEAWIKEGTGSKPANDLLAHFYPSLHMKDSIIPVRTYAAVFVAPYNKAGWHVNPVLIPFWHDDTY